MSKPDITIEAEARSRVVPKHGELGGRLAGLTIPRQVVMLAFWPLLEQIQGFLVGVTDQVLAGRFATSELRVSAFDALALGGYVGWLLMILQGAVAIGGLALISRATGAGDSGLAQRGLGQALLLGTMVGVAVALVMQVCLGPLIRLYQLDGLTAQMAEEYLQILVWTAPMTGWVLAANAALRAEGDTRSPFLVMTVVNIVNIGASWMFVYGPEPFGGHGVRGLAAGTLCGWMAGVAMVTLILMRRKEGIRLVGRELFPHRETLGRIVRVGLPSGIEVTGMWTINALLLRIIAGLPGEGHLGAHIVAIRCESLSFLAGFALGAAGATLAGQYIGLGDYDKARRAVLVCWFAGLGLMSAVGLIFLIYPAWMVGLIVPDATLIEKAVPLVFLCGLTQPFLATCIIFKTAFRGAGDTRSVMRISYASMLVFRLGGAFLVAEVFGWGLLAIWLVMALDLVVQSGMFLRRFRSGRWLDARV